MELKDKKKKLVFLCSESAGMNDWQFVCEAESLEEAEQLCKDYNGHTTSQGREAKVMRELTQKEIESKTEDGAYEIDHDNNEN